MNWRDSLIQMHAEAISEFKEYADHGYRKEPNFLDRRRGYQGTSGYKYPLPDEMDIAKLEKKIGRRQFRREVSEMGDGYYFSLEDALVSTESHATGFASIKYLMGNSEKKFLKKFTLTIQTK